MTPFYYITTTTPPPPPLTFVPSLTTITSPACPLLSPHLPFSPFPAYNSTVIAAPPLPPPRSTTTASSSSTPNAR